MNRVVFCCLLLFVAYAFAAKADVRYLQGVIRDQAPNTMDSCDDGKGTAGDANGGKGFYNTDFELAAGSYKDDEFNLVGKECNASHGWYPPACAAIGADRTPVYAYKGVSPGNNIRSAASFYTWFHDSNQTRSIPYNISLTQKTGSTYSYANDNFFPIDGRGWKDSCYGHNFAYCLEAHTRFGYGGAEVFEFSGDDDVWVFIDDRLVIDLGSLHPKRTRSIALNSIKGLVPGQNYRLDFFYCERHTVYSRMQLTTSIEFYCSYYDWCGFCEGTGQSCCTSEIISTYCDDKDACTTDTCSTKVSPITDPKNGCVHTPIACATTNKCENANCDKNTGCQITPLSCDDGDDCTIDSCNPKTGCSHKVCNGTGCPSKCIPKPFTCDDGNPCTTDTQIYVNGTATQNCTNELNETICDDRDVCTNDFCDSSFNTTAKACIHKNITCTPNLCQDYSGCDKQRGCNFTAKVCPGADDFCKVATCDLTAGCIVADKVCVVNDPHCFKGVCNSGEKKCSQEKVSDFNTAVSGNGVLCVLRYNDAVKGAAIGTGAAVGIAIGGAAAFGIFGYGGKKGYDYIKLMRNQKFEGVHNNPLYEQTKAQSDNPLYRYSNNPGPA